MDAELRKVKVYKGLSRETEAFTAQLWVDGGYIADVRNDGNGGANFIEHRFDGNGLNTRPQVAGFEAWCKAQPPHVSEHGDLTMDADFYVTLMLEDYEEQQQVKRWCKTKTVVKLASNGDGEYQTYNRAYTPEFAKKLKELHARNLIKIMNEAYPAKAAK